MKLSSNTKRACIYFIYDKDGIVDDYVLSQLKDIKRNVSFLHCVVNGVLLPESKKKLEPIVDEIFERENKGVDIGAYKAATEHIGWSELNKFDELVLMNNTCFGPVYPFKEVFDWASKKDMDIWGLTLGTKFNWFGTKDYLHYNKSKTHIQSYFIVFRKPLLGSGLLTSFFRDMPEEMAYVDSSAVFEYALPGYFEERGYKSGVYCDLKNDTNYPLLHNPVRLLKDCRMPLFKKRSFFHHYTDVLNNTGGEATLELIRFIEKETDYDMSLVWKALLRTCNLSDLVRCAQLNRILSSETVLHPNESKSLKVGVVYHAYYQDMFEDNLAYLANFPIDVGLLVTTNTAEKKAVIEKTLKKLGIAGNVALVENRGRDISALLVGAANFVENYDLICFAHDKKTTAVKPYSVGRSWEYKLNQSMFATKEYVENVINLFEREPQLGIAFPSAPVHSNYTYSIGNGWSGNFGNTRKVLDQFGANVKLNEHTLCVAPLGTCFWFRKDALKKLFTGFCGRGWSYSDFPREPNRCDQTLLHAIERSYAYMAQAAGYYPVYLYNSEYAQIEITNLEFGKAGSADMREWVEKLAMNSIGHSTDSRSQQNNQEQPQYSANVDYGIKQSLIHLAYSIRCKHPKFWAFLLPARRIGQKILRIKTK